MKVNPNIFKAYDIRGKYPAEVNETVAYELGRAVVDFFRKKSKKKNPTLIVCRDLRMSSSSLRGTLIRGIIAAGGSVLDVGVGTTPFFTFVINTAKAHQGGIMVTASHNPAEYNGFKIRDGKGNMVFLENGLKEIQEIIGARPKPVRKNEPGIITESAEYHEKYITFLSRRVKVGKLSAVVDAAGGSAALFLPKLLTQFPKLLYKPLFFEPDGSFRRHSPNPLSPEGQRFVREEMKKHSFQLGILFDGDADRVIFFDEKGDVIKSEFILALLAEEILMKKPKSWFILPVNTSRGAREYIIERGGRVKISRVGYVFIQQAMKRLEALLAAEISGHFHFKDFFFSDTGIFTALCVMRVLSQTPKTLSYLVKPMAERYISSGEMNFMVRNKKKLLTQIKGEYRRTKAKMSYLDGVNVDFPEWWFNVRVSNTEPLVRLVLEAKTKELFDEKYKEVESIIKSQ